MKKICLVTGLFSLSMFGRAQQKDLHNTDTIIKTVATPEERIGRLETEITALKASYTEMQKQLSELQTTMPVNSKKKKLVVNRAGSKQVTWSANEN